MPVCQDIRVIVKILPAIHGRLRDQAMMTHVTSLFPDELARTKVEGEARGVIIMGREFGLSNDEIIGHISSKLNCSQS